MVFAYVMLCYSGLWATLIIAIRGSVRGDLLRANVAKAKTEGREYHRFNRGIMLLAFTPLVLILLAIVARLLLDRLP
jgi:hypothetical protein